MEPSGRRWTVVGLLQSSNGNFVFGHVAHDAVDLPPQPANVDM